jgi:hypothetical protein
MNCDSLQRRLCCFKKAPCCANAHPGRHAHKYITAINLFVESDGSQPKLPVYLCGGEQARRHRVVSNRGHNLLRSYVESQDNGALYERTHPR